MRDRERQKSLGRAPVGMIVLEQERVPLRAESLDLGSHPAR